MDIFADLGATFSLRARRENSYLRHFSILSGHRGWGSEGFYNRSKSCWSLPILDPQELETSIQATGFLEIMKLDKCLLGLSAPKSEHG